MSMQELYEVKIAALMFDKINDSPVIILKTIDGEHIIPIWIGLFEANAIGLEIEKIPAPRPMTHDLIKNIFFYLDVNVKKVVITDIVENTFYAEIHLGINDDIKIVDSRPSDAIALALKTDSPILVTREIIDNSISIDNFSNISDEEQDINNLLSSFFTDDYSNIEQ